MCVVVCVRVCVYALLGASFLLFWCPFQHRLVVCFLLVFNYDCLLVLLYFARASSVCVCVRVPVALIYLFWLGQIIVLGRHTSGLFSSLVSVRLYMCIFVYQILILFFLVSPKPQRERETSGSVGCRAMPRFSFVSPAPPPFQCSSSFDGAY